MNIDNIIDYALSKPQNFPGKHNVPTCRTYKQQQPLEPKAQCLIIWRSFIQYMDDQLRAGRSVNIRKFGAFTFDVDTELPKISMGRQVNINADMSSLRADRKNVHHLKPRFVVDEKIQYHLNRYHGKEQINPPGSQKSIYSKGFRMIYANSVPIASAAQMGKEVVDDCLQAIFLAVEDLIRQDRNLSLQMGFCCMRFTNRALNTHFASYLGKEVGNKDFETQMRRTNSPVSTMWKTNT